MTDRLTCSVFGCNRYTRKTDSDEIICQNHWRTVPADLRKRFAKAKAIAKKNPTPKNINRLMRLWRGCVDEASLNQFGI